MALVWWMLRPWWWKPRSGEMFLLSTPASRPQTAEPGEERFTFSFTMANRTHFCTIMYLCRGGWHYWHN